MSAHTLTWKMVTTRKPQWCFGCDRQFPKGTNMRYWTVVDSGDWNSGYYCRACEAITAELLYLEFMQGDLRGEAIEWEEENPKQLTPRPGGDSQ